MATENDTPIFYCIYGETDEAEKKELSDHLSNLYLQHQLQLDFSGKIGPQVGLDLAASPALHRADFVFILMSAQLLALPQLHDNIIPQILDLHARGKLKYLPIILRYCDWRHTPLANVGILPRDGAPISSFADPSFAWQSITESVRRLLRRFHRDRVA